MQSTYSLCFRIFGFVMTLILATGCVANNNVVNGTPSTLASPTSSITQSPSLDSTLIVPSPIVSLAATATVIEPVWEIRENWTSANQIRTVLVDQSGDLWTGGPAGVVHWDMKTNTPTVYAIRGDPENTNVVSLSQTSDGAIWAGTFGNGLARFDGESWESFTTADGVPDNYIVAQTVTSHGELWFTSQRDQYSKDKDTIENSHIVRFDGINWIIEEGIAFDRLVTLPDDSIVSVYNEPPVGVYFHSQIGIYNGQSWNDLGIYPDEWINAITVDPDGVMWFATRDIVYRYENHKWQEIAPPWAGKDSTHVSSIAVSEDGVAWFGFSRRAAFDIDPCGDRAEYDEEYGIYRYDGKTWIHFTAKDGLADNKICAIVLDSSGNVWFGSFDKGVSRFDGNDWTSYVIP